MTDEAVQTLARALRAGEQEALDELRWQALQGGKAWSMTCLAWDLRDEGVSWPAFDALVASLDAAWPGASAARDSGA